MTDGNEVGLIRGADITKGSLLFNMVNCNDGKIVRFDDGISDGTADGGDDGDAVGFDGSTAVCVSCGRVDGVDDGDRVGVIDGNVAVGRMRREWFARQTGFDFDAEGSDGVNADEG